jgi:hypothetical protein
MFTLKIQYPDSTEWVTGVTTVEDVGVACTGADMPCTTDGDNRAECDYIISLFPGPANRWRGTINVRPMRPNMWMRSLIVTLGDRQATYIVPQGETYLLSPTGDTVDRI